MEQRKKKQLHMYAMIEHESEISNIAMVTS